VVSVCATRGRIVVTRVEDGEVVAGGIEERVAWLVQERAEAPH
jgi:predicted aspartyl protease